MIIKIIKLGDVEFKNIDEVKLFLMGELPIKKGYFLLRSLRGDARISQPTLFLFHFKGKIYGEGIAIKFSEGLKGYPDLNITYKKGDQEFNYPGFLRFIPQSIRMYKTPIDKALIADLGHVLAAPGWNILSHDDYFVILEEVCNSGGFISRFELFK